MNGFAINEWRIYQSVKTEFLSIYVLWEDFYEPYPQLRHNAKMAKSVGAFCTESHWEETKSRP